MVNGNSNWTESAERLRLVRQATGQFLARWAAESLLSASAALDRVDQSLKEFTPPADTQSSAAVLPAGTRHRL